MGSALRDTIARETAGGAVAQVPVVSGNALTQPGRVGTRPQHSLIVIRLQHQNVDFVTERAHIFVHVADIVADAGAGAGGHRRREKRDGLTRVMGNRKGHEL